MLKKEFKIPYFFELFIITIITISISKINAIAGILSAIAFIILYLIKKNYTKSILIIPIILNMFLISDIPNKSLGMLGTIIDKDDSKYKIMINKFYDENWKKTNKIYITYYSKFSVEPLKNGQKIYLYGKKQNNNIIKTDYIATKGNKSILQIKDLIINQLKNRLKDPNTFDIVKSSIMGNIQNKEKFKKTGTLHLFAVSGFHVYIIYFIISKIINLLIYKKNIRLILSTIIINFYLILTGFSASSLRAVLLLSIINIFKILDLQYDSLNILSLIGYINLIIIPENLQNIGFLMSYSATFMILYTNKKLYKSKIKNIIIPISAYIGIFPISLYSFGEISLSGIIITPIISPIIGLLILLGFFNILINSVILQSFTNTISSGILNFLKIFENIPLLKIENNFLIFIIWCIIFIFYIIILNHLIKPRPLR
jgi:competence protein ComEC